MKDRLIAKVTIEPSYSHGFATWVRSKESANDVWWKWYVTKDDAFTEADRLRFLITQFIPEGLSVASLRVLKESVLVDTEELVKFGFEDRTGSSS